MRPRPAVAGALAAFAALQIIRFPEPLGLDQSLFAFYGDMLGRGLVLYRDLWDNKPPLLFVLYAMADRVAGVAHAAWLLDAVAALAAAIVAWHLASRLFASRTAGACAAIVCALAPSAPVFDGPMLAGQAEPLLAPLVLASMLLASRSGRRAAFAAGLLIAAAALVKLVALVLLPIVVVTSLEWRDRRRAVALAAGVVAPLAIAGLVLAIQGALADAVTATLVYPRAYAAEIASRMPLAPTLARGGSRLLRGLPILIVLAAVGFTGWRTRPVRLAFAWLVLAAAGVAAQRQMAGYQLYFLMPPLALLAAAGAVRLQRWVSSGPSWRLALVGAVAMIPIALEARLCARQYAPHVALAFGRIDRNAFWQNSGGPGPRWIEAHAIAGAIRAEAPTRDASLLVWGLAPQVYALAGLRPATRYAFHQTFYVENSPLARRFPDARIRRTELLATLDRDPPRAIVVVHGDRSGLEPQDSAAELAAFPELAARLAASYHERGRTASFQAFLAVD